MGPISLLSVLKYDEQQLRQLIFTHFHPVEDISPKSIRMRRF